MNISVPKFAVCLVLALVADVCVVCLLRVGGCTTTSAGRVSSSADVAVYLPTAARFLGGVGVSAHFLFIKTQGCGGARIYILTWYDLLLHAGAVWHPCHGGVNRKRERARERARE